MAKLINVKNAGLNSGASVLGKMKRLSELKKHPILENVFLIQPDTLAAIVESMKINCYDNAQPIVEGRIDGVLYIVDGYTRYEAASQAGIDEVPVDEKDFENLEAAIHYCYRRQAERRNLTQAEIYSAAVKLNLPIAKLAEELGVCESSIKRAKKIEREAGQEDIEDIKNNKTTINAVYNKLKQSKPKPEKPDEPDGDELPEDADSELENNQEPADDASFSTEDADILDDVVIESDTVHLDADMLDGAVTETDEDISRVVIEIVSLLSENGESAAAALIKKAYHYFFNENRTEI